MKGRDAIEPRQETVRLRGEPFHCLHYPGPDEGTAPLLVWVHATGFNAETYRNMLGPLAGRMEILALDMRGHGFTGASARPADLTSWDVYRDDLLDLLDQFRRPLYLAGHSFGAVACIGAALKRPEQVRGLVLVEPVLLNRWAGLGFLAMKVSGRSHRFSLARSAARRRAVFHDAEGAFSRYHGRGAFRTWPDPWIRDYLAGGLRRRPDGAVELCCNPAWESRSFSVTPCNVWPRIARLRCPLSLLVGEHHSTCNERTVQRFLRLQPRTRFQRLDHTSHFLPMERPETVQGEILATAGLDHPSAGEAQGIASAHGV